MSTKRQRRPQGRREPVSDVVWQFLETGDLHAEDPNEFLDLFHLTGNGDALRAVWIKHHDDEILEDFITECPGRRPWAWWEYDAPELRRRVGGTGTEKWIGLRAHLPVHAFGIPAAWTDEWEVRYYTGRAVDVHGHPIGQEFRGRHFAGVAIVADDLPRFESEAAFLARHHLLSADERAQLDDHDFEPEDIQPFVIPEEDHNT